MVMTLLASERVQVSYCFCSCRRNDGDDNEMIPYVFFEHLLLVYCVQRALFRVLTQSRYEKLADDGT